jgi:hypothetical protein
MQCGLYLSIFMPEKALRVNNMGKTSQATWNGLKSLLIHSAGNQVEITQMCVKANPLVWPVASMCEHLAWLSIN